MTTTIGSLDLNAFNDLYSDSTQYFWFESNASATYGAGAHVTLVPDTSFISNPTGQNILMNTDGFSIRYGLLPMMTLDNNSLDFNVVDTTEGTFITTAAFSSTSAQIGQREGAHSIIDVDGMKVYASDGTTLLATMGFGDIYPDQPGVKSAYYTFGIRHPDEPLIGVYSFAEGLRIMATGFWSHAEGYYTEANGDASHAEGYYTKANAACSHAEGRFTETRGGAYHFTSSHASGLGTVVNGWGSTALGAYNEDDLQVDTFTYDGTTNTFKLTHPISYNGLFDSLAYYVMVEIDGKELYPYERRYSVYHPTDDPTVVIKSPPSEGATIKISYATTNNIFTIGNGTSDDARSNALTVDWDGNVVASGSIVTDSNFNQEYSVTVSSLAGNTYLGQAIDLGEVGLKHPIFTGYDIVGSGTARIHTLGHYLYKENGHWKAYIKMRNDDTSAINNFTVKAYITWI